MGLQPVCFVYDWFVVLLLAGFYMSYVIVKLMYGKWDFLLAVGFALGILPN